MTTADGFCLSDLGKVHPRVKVDCHEYEHSFIVANITNAGILGRDFLRMHGGNGMTLLKINIPPGWASNTKP